MRAAIRLGGKVSKIAMYEPPYNNDPGAQESWSRQLRTLEGQTHQVNPDVLAPVLTEFFRPLPGQPPRPALLYHSTLPRSCGKTFETFPRR